VGREIVGRHGREKGAGDARTSGVDWRVGPSRQRRRRPNPSTRLRWRPSERASVLGQHRGVGRGALAGQMAAGMGRRGKGCAGWVRLGHATTLGHGQAEEREGGRAGFPFIYLFLFLFSPFLIFFFLFLI
jgi:hypothetical protein